MPGRLMMYFDRAVISVVIILFFLYGFLFFLVRFFVIGWSVWNISKFNFLVKGGYLFCMLLSVSLTIGLILNAP